MWTPDPYFAVSVTVEPRDAHCLLWLVQVLVPSIVIKLVLSKLIFIPCFLMCSLAIRIAVCLLFIRSHYMDMTSIPLRLRLFTHQPPTIKPVSCSSGVSVRMFSRGTLTSVGDTKHLCRTPTSVLNALLISTFAELMFRLTVLIN